MSMDRWDLEDHLVGQHKFDEVAVEPQNRDDDELEQDHEDAHRVGQLIWEPHTHDRC